VFGADAASSSRLAVVAFAVDSPRSAGRISLDALARPDIWNTRNASLA
jgi:hypothetical protein